MGMLTTTPPGEVAGSPASSAAMKPLAKPLLPRRLEAYRMFDEDIMGVNGESVSVNRERTRER